MAELVWDRPLDPRADADVWLSRAADVERVVDLARDGDGVVFLWAPPGWGTTTFLRELALAAEGRFRVRMIDARDVGELDTDTSGDDDDRRLLLLMDEAEECDGAGDVEAALDAVAPLLGSDGVLVITGDRLVRDRLDELELPFPIVECELAALDIREAATRLVVEPLLSRGHHVGMDAAELLCRECGTNPYLIQRAAAAFGVQHTPYPRGEAQGIPEMQAFLRNMDRVLADYFDRLVDGLLKHETAPHVVIDLFEGRTPVDISSLKGLGVTAPDGGGFASHTLEAALRRRCTRYEFARQAAGRDLWARAVAFYGAHLEHTAGSLESRAQALEEALNAAFLAADVDAYVSFARSFSAICPAGRRSRWLEDVFVPQVARLLEPLPEGASAQVLEAVAQAVDVVTRTGRVRIYLVDATGDRLVCRTALGPWSAEFINEPIALASRDWKAAAVYVGNAAAFVEDTGSDPEFNGQVARANELHSCWLFPIPLPGDDASALGVLCVDNPAHVSDRPGDIEREIAAVLLPSVAGALTRAKSGADRSDLLFRIEQLSSLHEHLLTEHGPEEVLQALFRVATALHPVLSMINVRLRAGYRLDRLVVAGYWPPQLEQVFDAPDMATLSFPETFAKEADEAGIRVVDDVYDDTHGIAGLSRFMRHVQHRQIELPLGSLFSFRVQTGGNYLGTCNFYTRYRYRFTPDELQALSLVVKQAALALYNKQQIAAMRRQRQGLQILTDCVSQINDGWPLADVIAAMTQRVAELFDVHSASFLLADQASDRLDYVYTWSQEAGGEDRVVPVPEGASVSRHAMVTSGAQVLSVDDEAWAATYFERVPGILTSAAIPMKDADGTVTGVLALESQDRDAFTPDDIHLVETVVAQIPVAMNNARLVAELRDALNELEITRWTEAMGVTAASSVHRVSNLAGGIPGYAERVREQLDAHPFRSLSASPEMAYVMDTLERIQGAGEDLLHVSARLLASGRTPDPSSFVDVAVCDLASDLARRLVSADGIPWRCLGPADLVVHTDRERLTDILSCLLHNAASASARAAEYDTTRTPEVIVDVGRYEENVTIRVRDTGLGIPASLATELGRMIVNSNWHGNGLGLFVSTRHAAMLRGSLRLVHNTREGAAFELQLPLHHEEARART